MPLSSSRGALGAAPLLPSAVISLVRLMDEVASNYPVEGPIMRLTLEGSKLMMRRASHLHSIKVIEPLAQGRRGGDGRVLLLEGL